MWDNVIESLQQLKDDDVSAPRGCILAHCMGLGKTLSVCVHSSQLNSNAKQTKIDLCSARTGVGELESRYKESNGRSVRSPVVGEKGLVQTMGFWSLLWVTGKTSGL